MSKLQDKGIEEDVNRAIISNDGAINQVLRYSDSENLMRDEDQHLVWKAAVRLSKEDKKVDPALVRTKVVQEGWASESKIDRILQNLTAAPESDDNLDDWASELHKLYSKRKAMKVYGEAQSRIKKGEDYSDVREHVGNELSEVSNVHSRKELDEVLSDLMADIDAHRQGGTLRTGLKLGIPKFDQLTNGIGDSYLVIIAAVPKAGKTVLGWQTVDNVLENSDRRVVVVSLEMQEDDILERWLSMRSMVGGEKIQKADLTDEEWEAVKSSRDKIRNWAESGRIKVITQKDIPGTATAEKVRNVVIAEHSQDPIGYLLLDYFQLLDFGDTSEAERAVHTVNSIPKSLGIPTTLISQFNRGPRNENRPPRTSDLHATSALENDLDVLVLMDRKDMRVPESEWAAAGVVEGQVDCNMALHRHGNMGRWSMQMDNEVPVFVINPSSRPETSKGKETETKDSSSQGFKIEDLM